MLNLESDPIFNIKENYAKILPNLLQLENEF